MTEIEQLKDELERVKRQAAAMREALVEIDHEAASLVERDESEMECLVVRYLCRLGLSETGSEFLTREQVKLIIGPLAARHHFEGKPQRQEWMDDETFRGAMNAWEMANRALEEARKLGLTP
jgi:hypothetical protein